jgi:hypothetical protein
MPVLGFAVRTAAPSPEPEDDPGIHFLGRSIGLRVDCRVKPKAVRSSVA